jgi:hypothetical protein
MANVLPPKELANLQKGYWGRLILAFSMVTSIAFIVGIASLFPAYVAARSEHQSAKRYQDIQSQERNIGADDEAVLSARLVRVQIDELKDAADSRVSHAVGNVIRDWEARPGGISISGFEYDRKTGKEPTLRVSGLARNRQELSDFVDMLRQDPLFDSAQLPVSDLAESSEIAFSVILTGKF